MYNISEKLEGSDLFTSSYLDGDHAKHMVVSVFFQW